MDDLIYSLNLNTLIQIKDETYEVKTKTWYSIEEDNLASYIKCELSNGKVLVIIPDDDLIYIGSVVEDMNYERISNDSIKFNDRLFSRTGDGHQFITKIEFGSEDEVEGKCIFEDYESDNNIISLGILPDKDNQFTWLTVGYTNVYEITNLVKKDPVDNADTFKDWTTNNKTYEEYRQYLMGDNYKQKLVL